MFFYKSPKQEKQVESVEQRAHPGSTQGIPLIKYNKITLTSSQSFIELVAMIANTAGNLTISTMLRGTTFAKELLSIYHLLRVKVWPANRNTCSAVINQILFLTNTHSVDNNLVLSGTCSASSLRVLLFTLGKFFKAKPITIVQVVAFYTFRTIIILNIVDQAIFLCLSGCQHFASPSTVARLADTLVVQTITMITAVQNAPSGLLLADLEHGLTI